MNVNIYSDYEFLIDVKNQSYILSPQNHIFIEEIQTPLAFKVYPLEQGELSLPYAFELKYSNNKIECKSQNVKVYNINNRCDIFLTPFLLPSIKCVYNKTHTVKNVKYNITAYQDRIKISSTRGEYVFLVKVFEAQSESVGNYIYVLVKNDKKTLVCYDCTNNTFSNVNGDFIEIKNDQIVVSQNFDDMAHHTKVVTLKNDLKETKSEIYIDESKSKNCKIDQLVPYNFFEAIKCKDTKTSQSYLNDDLKKALENQDITQFFGDFEKMNLTSLSPLVYTLYYNEEAKDFKITVNNGKIEEIEN